MSQEKKAEFRVLAIAEKGGIHQPFVDAAKIWLAKKSDELHFRVEYISNTDPIDEESLKRYQLFIQLNFPPCTWTPAAMAAFTRYIEQGKAAGLDFTMPRCSASSTVIRCGPGFRTSWAGSASKNYLAKFATAKVTVDDPSHPAMQGIPSSFVVQHEEWYTYNKSPRPNVHRAGERG